MLMLKEKSCALTVFTSNSLTMTDLNDIISTMDRPSDTYGPEGFLYLNI